MDNYGGRYDFHTAHCRGKAFNIPLLNMFHLCILQILFIRLMYYLLLQVFWKIFIINRYIIKMFFVFIDLIMWISPLMLLIWRITLALDIIKVLLRPCCWSQFNISCVSSFLLAAWFSRLVVQDFCIYVHERLVWVSFFCNVFRFC